MSLGDELKAQAQKTLSSQWEHATERSCPRPRASDSETMPSNSKLPRFLYADLSDSTGMVSGQPDYFAAEVYKTFLYTAARVIRSEGGEITAYDGDRVMAVYLGDRKNTSAARSALKINDAVDQIINPAITAQYPNRSFTLHHVVGIDTQQPVCRAYRRTGRQRPGVGRPLRKLCGEIDDSKQLPHVHHWGGRLPRRGG